MFGWIVAIAPTLHEDCSISPQYYRQRPAACAVAVEHSICSSREFEYSDHGLSRVWLMCVTASTAHRFRLLINGSSPDSERCVLQVLQRHRPVPHARNLSRYRRERRLTYFLHNKPPGS